MDTHDDTSAAKRYEANQLFHEAYEAQLEQDYDRAIDEGLIRRFNPTNAYYEHLETLVDIDKISQGELNIVADPMYGSGRTAIRAILSRTRCHVTEIRGDLNPGFGGIHPEPIRKYLDMLAATINSAASAPSSKLPRLAYW